MFSEQRCIDNRISQACKSLASMSQDFTPEPAGPEFQVRAGVLVPKRAYLVATYPNIYPSLTLFQVHSDQFIHYVVEIYQVLKLKQSRYFGEPKTK